ncbi:Protein of unknown function [Pyronema omphalodes CBS 100304]|uniref:Uncharacterized protein n=1 Tax=Pyronema omphalodes (strain CBS 100304) TaxID=1076935 RepID=U4LLH1_PYROM|nr:Protein of unknown function [Pyronema omphalodes CBS 100304]
MHEGMAVKGGLQYSGYSASRHSPTRRLASQLINIPKNRYS